MSAYTYAVSYRDCQQADTPQAALFRLWGRGAVPLHRAGGALLRPHLCKNAFPPYIII